MSEIISVVIPCYNGEKYIEKCLKSILNQTYTNLEVILVNDGSTDKTKELVRPFLKDPRMKYIEQENGGEFAARNTGIKAATGDYVGFVDADDYINSDMYEKLYALINETDSDVAVCNFNIITKEQDAKIKQAYAIMPNGVLDIYEDIYGYWTRTCATLRPNNYVWTRLYRLKVVIDSAVLFENYKHSADTLFNFKLLPHLKRVAFLNEGLYNYVQHNGSGIHTIANKGNIASLYADTFQALSDYYKDNEYTGFLSVLPIHAYTRLRSIFFYSRLAGHTDEEIVDTIRTGWKDRDIFKYLTGGEL